MQDFIIRNKSKQTDSMVLMRIGLYIAGQKEDDAVTIRATRTGDGSRIFVVTDKYQGEENWKEAAEGLALMIESQKVRM